MCEKVLALWPQPAVWVFMCVCVLCCDVTPMWFKGWEAEMKHSVLDRNAWLANSALRQMQKRKGQDRSSLETRRLKRGRACIKQIFLNNLTQRKKQRGRICKHLLLCIVSETNCSSASGSDLLHDFDGGQSEAFCFAGSLRLKRARLTVYTSLPRKNYPIVWHEKLPSAILESWTDGGERE